MLPPLEVDSDSVRKDGVGTEVKVDGVVAISVLETDTNFRDEIRLLLGREDSYRYDRLSCILLW